MRRAHKNSKNSFRPFPPPPKEVSQIIHYWLDCFRDAERMEITSTDIRNLGTELPITDLLEGSCPPNIITQLQNKAVAEEAKRSSRGEKLTSRKDEGILKVLLCPLRLVWNSHLSARDLDMPPFLELLWIPADLTTEGELIPPHGRFPWFPRTLLGHTDDADTVIIGQYEDTQKFIKNSPPINFDSWRAYWKWCDEFFKAVCGTRTSEYSMLHYQTQKNALILIDTKGGGSTKEARRIYSEVIDQKRNAPLLLKLTSLKEPKRIDVKQTVPPLRQGSLLHLGQMQYDYPLSPAQRQAVHQSLLTPEGEILAVTGPPGTGKTTFLQSVIASLWVNAARRKNGLPPIIVACAGTNQAVTNIVKSFEQAAEKPGPLAGRWLPGVKSYGCYCVAKSKAEEAGDFHIEQKNGAGLSADMEQWEYVNNAKKYYLERASQYAGKELTLKKALQFFHGEMYKEISLLNGTINKAADPTGIAFLQNLFGMGKQVSVNDFQKVLGVVDGLHRHAAFQFATHYWEARWLLVVDDIVNAKINKNRQPQGFFGSQEDWQRRAMITPCFVATFSTAPAFFNYQLPKGVPLIDLLIVDEASQVSAEEGAACFSLAKRAVVVGDPQQLEPVREIPPYIDIENLKTRGLIRRNEEKEFAALSKRGLTASEGSLMQLSLMACPVRENNMRGIFLAEHHRSLPGIIAFCNELAYGNRLRATEKSLENPIFPPLGYAHVPGVSKRVGHSQENPLEAQTIALWLSENRKLIEDYYGGAVLDKLVAVITPYFAQKRLLQNLLYKTYPEMTIGTVHGLQGAERPMVIFSPVCDEKARSPYFFDQGVQMLNVAVSRAKHSFLVFGNMSIFNPEAKTPSGLLAKFLFKDSGNELTGITLPSHPDFRKEEIKRLTTLGDHQKILQAAFEHAKHEVLVVSPTISRFAIEADNIPEMIRKASDRGVNVLVYVDLYLNMNDNTKEFRPAARIACDLLEEAGAKLYIVKGIHNKTLTIDDEVIIEGSFNWFSAVRNIQSRTHKQEHSMQYTGPKAAEQIRITKETLSFLRDK